MLLTIAFGSSTLEASYEQDEKANFNKLQITFPLTKTEIVISKYLLALMCTGISALIALVYVLANVYLNHMVTLAEALTVWGAEYLRISCLYRHRIYLLLPAGEKDRKQSFI